MESIKIWTPQKLASVWYIIALIQSQIMLCWNLMFSIQPNSSLLHVIALQLFIFDLFIVQHTENRKLWQRAMPLFKQAVNSLYHHSFNRFALSGVFQHCKVTWNKVNFVVSKCSGCYQFSQSPIMRVCLICIKC